MRTAFRLTRQKAIRRNCPQTDIATCMNCPGSRSKLAGLYFISTASWRYW
jgi:hypothetical protein